MVNRTKYVIIGLSGKRGSGKDELARKLAPYGWEKVSFAEELKQRTRDDFNLTVEHTDGKLKEVPCGFINDGGRELTPRDIMTMCGKYYRSIDPMFWVKSAFRRVNKLDGLIDVHKIVVTDVRFENEVRSLREHGAFIVRINRPLALNIYKIPLNDISETGLDNYTFDYVIPEERNIDFADLEREAKALNDMYSPKAAEVVFKI